MNFRLLIPISVLALAACSSSSQQDPDPDPTALVKTANAQDGSVASSQAVYGAVEIGADTQFTLSAPVEAIVSRIAAPLGTAVARRQLVIALSPSPATRADMARFSAEARLAQQAYDRARRLRADGLVSDTEVESAHSALQSAQASRAALAAQSGQLALRAPGSGFVQSIASNPGDLVSPGATIATISRNGDLRARFGIDPALLPRLSRGAGLQLEAGNGASPVALPIRSVDPTADPQTRLASIYVTVPASLRSGAGQPLRGTVTLEQSGSAIIVPYAALLDDGGQPYVFTIVKGVAHRKDVSVGASDGRTVAITSGIAAGDAVVTEGGTALEDGMKVRTR